MLSFSRLRYPSILLTSFRKNVLYTEVFSFQAEERYADATMEQNMSCWQRSMLCPLRTFLGNASGLFEALVKAFATYLQAAVLQLSGVSSTYREVPR